MGGKHWIALTIADCNICFPDMDPLKLMLAHTSALGVNLTSSVSLSQPQNTPLDVVPLKPMLMDPKDLS